MHIGTTQSQSSQSQSLFAALDISRTRTLDSQEETISTHIEGHISLLRTEKDVVDITQVDISFTQNVLRDSLQEHLNAPLETAGIEGDAGELLTGNLDTSPAVTADRIAAFALGFFDTVKANNEEKEQTLQLDNFIGMISGAVEKGFATARGILNDIGNVPTQVDTDINDTFELVMDRITAFAEEQREHIAREQRADGDVLIS